MIINNRQKKKLFFITKYSLNYFHILYHKQHMKRFYNNIIPKMQMHMHLEHLFLIIFTVSSEPFEMHSRRLLHIWFQKPFKFSYIEKAHWLIYSVNSRCAHLVVHLNNQIKLIDYCPKFPTEYVTVRD